jgi:CDP-diacylglycerol--glycerol-3-phosphate 3-phosphatidyltransferase
MNEQEMTTTETKKNKVMNVPNMLSLLRCLMVPFFMAAIIFMKDIAIWGRIVPAILFALTAITDMLDGKIARKYNLITNFGKFIDPLADKFMVFAALLTICYAYSYIAPFFIWVAVVIMFRELGVTSLRLVVSGNAGIVVAASLLGKLKTVSQMVGLFLIILEPLIIPTLFDSGIYLISYIMAGIMTVTTLFSGYDYLRAYLPYIKE